jgi:hypothetical protein
MTPNNQDTYDQDFLDEDLSSSADTDITDDYLDAELDDYDLMEDDFDQNPVSTQKNKGKTSTQSTKTSPKFSKSTGKKPPLFNVLLIGGAGLAAVIVLYFTLFSGSSAPTDTALPSVAVAQNATPLPDPNQMDPAQAAGATPVAPVDSQVGVTPAQPSETVPGFMNNPEILNTPPAQADSSTAIPEPAPTLTEALPAPALPSTSSSDQPSIPEPVVDNTTENIATPTPPAELPQKVVTDSVDQAALPQQDPLKQEAPAALLPTAQDIVKADALEPKVTEAPVAVSEAEKLEPTPTSNPITNLAPTSDPVSASTSTTSKEMEEQLAQALARISTLEQQLAEARSQPKSESKDSAKAPKQVASEREKAKPKKRSESAGRSSNKAASGQRWELRAANPMQAMVASPNGGSLRSVTVGDTLSGIGEIRSIEQRNGSWVVIGSQGQIRQ